MRAREKNEERILEKCIVFNGYQYDVTYIHTHGHTQTQTHACVHEGVVRGKYGDVVLVCVRACVQIDAFRNKRTKTPNNTDTEILDGCDNCDGRGMACV